MCLCVGMCEGLIPPPSRASIPYSIHEVAIVWPLWSSSNYFGGMNYRPLLGGLGDLASVIEGLCVQS